MAGEEGVCKNPEVSWCPEVLEGKVRGVPVFGATVRDVRNVADFVNVNPDLGHSGHFQDPMNRWDVCYQELLQGGYGYPCCRLLFALLPTGMR